VDVRGSDAASVTKGTEIRAARVGTMVALTVAGRVLRGAVLALCGAPDTGLGSGVDEVVLFRWEEKAAHLAGDYLIREGGLVVAVLPARQLAL